MQLVYNNYQQNIYKYLKNYNLEKKTVLIKPNFNSNMDSLTGNTTDLRLIVWVINCLKDLKVKKIILGEGYSSGWHKLGIDIFRRLKIYELQKFYGFEIINFNECQKGQIIKLSNGKGGILNAKYPEELDNIDFFINLPKIKTHTETIQTCSLKSLVGCLIGYENKAKLHFDLFTNIIKLNQIIKSNIYIIDGLICMEGNGPSRGLPKRLDILIMGSNPYQLDYLVSKIQGFDFRQIPFLKIAYENGLLTQAIKKETDKIDISSIQSSFLFPKPNILDSFFFFLKLQRYFRIFKDFKPIKALLKMIWIKKILYLLGLTQDAVNMKERGWNDLEFNKDKCTLCNKCKKYCPVAIDLPAEIQNNNVNQKNTNCINCLYCYAVCPEEAISVKGELGFYKKKKKEYKFIIKKVS